MRLQGFLLLAAGLANAGRFTKRAPPSVTIANGTVIGETSWYNVDSWRGIPFADPPVGDMRLRRPRPVSYNFGTITATAQPKACTPLESHSGKSAGVFGAVGGGSSSGKVNYGEDCLNLNVQRPTGTTADSKLPVVVWIFGGGFESGSTQIYDGTNIITVSVKMGKPIIFVAINYRNGAFGFLNGKEMMDGKVTNLGWRDQRLALQWVQDNIGAFGGDPEKVTLWGESAGAISAMAHQILDGGNINYKGKPMFRAGIMNSGSFAPTVPANATKAQNVYDIVVREAGCDSANDTLSCLRSVPFEKFQYAANALPGIGSYSSVDLAYIPRPDPTDNFYPVSPEFSIKAGNYTHVPIITGDQDDEGTLFAQIQTNLTTAQALNNYFMTWFPNSSFAAVTGMTATYPEDAAAGSPYGTGDKYNFYPQFKRLAAILGDSVFTLKRRIYLEYVTKNADMPAWSYLATYDKQPYYGTFHGSDIYQTFVGTPNEIGLSILRYYVSFINELDPNALTRGMGGRMIEWPRWTGEGRVLMNFRDYDNAIIGDNFREKSYEWFRDHIENFET